MRIAELTEQKKTLKKAGAKCFFCGETKKRLDLVHIIRRSYSLELYSDPRNLILGCRECHRIFDDGSSEQIDTLNQDQLKEVMIRMKALDEQYFNRYTEKINQIWIL